MVPVNMAYPPLRVTVLGSGTSTGVPVIGCGCAVCRSEDPRNRRLRSSIKIEAGGRTLVVDCGVDFRQQMLAHPAERLDAVLITHTHADHIQGLDDLRVFGFRQDEDVPLYTSRPYIEDIKVRFAYCFDPPQIGSGVPRLELNEVWPGKPFAVGGVEIVPIEIDHGKLSILGFRFGKFAYLTDCSGIPDRSRAMLEGIEVLIVSALRSEPHPTHFNLDRAVEASRGLGVKRAYFIHMTHGVEHAQTEAALPDWARLTYDGLVLEIP